MRTNRFAHTRIAAALLAGLAPLAGPAAPLPGTPAGGETQLNAHIFFDQEFHAVGMDADGDFVATWKTYGVDGDGSCIMARRFDRNGAPLGDDFLVNTYLTSTQTFPDVAVDADGDFVVVWESLGQDGSGNGIIGQRYHRDGHALGGEFLVNRATQIGDQENPAIAMDQAGNFVVAFEGPDSDGRGIYVEGFARNGTRVTGFVFVNSHYTSTQAEPAVARSRDGEFVVVWQSFAQDGNGYGIYAQRHNLAGGFAGGEFRVNTFIAGHQWHPSAGMDADGDFVVVWESYQDGSDIGIYGQRFDRDGVAQGAEFAVNTLTAGRQERPRVAVDADGDFAVTWQSANQDGSGNAVMVRRFSRDGVAHAAETRVNTWTTGDQILPAIAMAANGGFIVAFESEHDGALFGIFGQRYEGYRAFAAAVPDLNGNLTPEIAGVAWNGAAWQARVRDGFTGEVLGSANFTAGYDVADFAFHGDAVNPALAIFARKPDATLNRLELRPLAGGASSVNVATTRPLRMAVIGDANNNGSSDLALLDVNDATGAARTIVRDGSGLSNIRTTSLPSGWRPVDLAALPDLSGNARPEVAVLAQNDTSGAVRVESRDAFTGALVNSTDFNPDYVPARLAVSADASGNGRPELLVAGVDDLHQQATVQVLDSFTDHVVGILRYGTWAPIAGVAPLPDQDGNGKPEIALLLQDPATDAPRLEIRDADTDAFVRSFSFSDSLVARDLLLLDDYDGTGGPELGVVATRTSDGADRAQVRDSVSGRLIKSSPVP